MPLPKHIPPYDMPDANGRTGPGFASLVTFAVGVHLTVPVVTASMHKCGNHFPAVLVIYEPESDNPGVQVDRPLGWHAVRSIMEHVKAHAANAG